MSKRARSEIEAAREMVKVLVLTDLGKDIDDAIALLWLARQAQLGRCQILGVITGGGSCRGRARAAQALLNAVLRLKPRAVLAPPVQDAPPVMPGADIPIDESMRGDIIWSAKVVTDVTGGAGSASDGDLEPQETDGPAAAQTIVDLCREHGKSMKILCIGPVTDLAHAVRLDREAVCSVGAVHFQGQCLEQDGAVRPDSQAFNFRCDMVAATEVLAALLPSVPVWMVGKFAAYQINLEGAHFTRWDGAAGHWAHPRFLDAVMKGLVHLCTDGRHTFDRVFGAEAAAAFVRAKDAGGEMKELAACLPFLSCPYDALAAMSMFPEAGEHFDATEVTDSEGRCVHCIGLKADRPGVRQPLQTRKHLLDSISACLSRAYVGSGPDDTAFESLASSSSAPPAQIPDPALVPEAGTSLKVVVGTMNPSKIAAVRETLRAGGWAVEVKGVETASGVPGQPVGATETFGGAANRARQAREAEAGADIWIGLENGLVGLDAAVAGASVLPHSEQAGAEGGGHGVWFETVGCAALCRWNGESVSLGSSMGVQVPLYEPPYGGDATRDWLADYSSYFFETQLPTAGFDTAMHHSGGWLARPECLRAATASAVGRLLPRPETRKSDSS